MRSIAGLIVAATSAACASAPQRASQAGPPAAVEVPRTVITPQQATSVPELFRQAEELAEKGQHGEAARAFRRVFELDAQGPLANEALYRAAVEHHSALELEAALADYEQVARLFPNGKFANAALVRATTVAVHLERYQRGLELAQRALAVESELSSESRVLLYAASALGRLEQGDEQGASSFIEKGRALIDERRLDAAGTISYELAPLYFALGELRRRRAERIIFVPMPPNFAEALERRCQLLLDAQSAYSDSMRAHDSHWSTMAGYRVGELYARLHEDVMRVEPPASADTTEKRQLFEGAMRLRYAILLEKALGMIDHTISMVERTRESSAWVERLRVAKLDIQSAMRREQEALAKLPFSRATLEAALQDLQARAQKSAAAQASSPTSSKKSSSSN